MIWEVVMRMSGFSNNSIFMRQWTKFMTNSQRFFTITGRRKENIYLVNTIDERGDHHWAFVGPLDILISVLNVRE